MPLIPPSLQRGAGGDFVGVKIGRADPEMQAGFPEGINKKFFLIQHEESFERGAVPEVNPDLPSKREALFAGERFQSIPPFRPPRINPFARRAAGRSRKIERHLSRQPADVLPACHRNQILPPCRPMFKSSHSEVFLRWMARSSAT